MDRNILRDRRHWQTGHVALRKESVDRNGSVPSANGGAAVALRKESVDRNSTSAETAGIVTVALRKESVDRNGHLHDVALEIIGSLSARRAWIEIQLSVRE